MNAPELAADDLAGPACEYGMTPAEAAALAYLMTPEEAEALALGMTPEELRQLLDPQPLDPNA